MAALISGIVLMVATAGAFCYSMPRRGKPAWFVGSAWEGYVVVAMIGGLGMSFPLVIVGLLELTQ